MPCTPTFQYICESTPGWTRASCSRLPRWCPSIPTRPWALKQHAQPRGHDFRHGHPGRRLMRSCRDLVAFYVVFEGMFLQTGFRAILALASRQDVGIGRHTSTSCVTSPIHLNLASYVINQIAAETRGCGRRLRAMCGRSRRGLLAFEDRLRPGTLPRSSSGCPPTPAHVHSVQRRPALCASRGDQLFGAASDVETRSSGCRDRLT